MGLKNVISSAASAAFSAVGDFSEDFILLKRIKNVHDTNVLKSIITTQNIEFKGIITDYSAREVDGRTILTFDRKIIALGKNFNGTAPQIDEEIIGPDNKHYDIKSVTSVPGNSIYELQVRPNEF